MRESSRSTRWFAPILLAALGAGPAQPALPRDLTVIDVAPASRFSLEGSTNVNTFSCRGEKLTGAMEVEATPDSIARVLRAIDETTPAPPRIPTPRLRLGIPVAQLACGNRGMERDMRRLLRSQSYPAILYDFESAGALHVTEASDGSGKRYGLTVQGELQVAGQARKVPTQVIAEVLSPTVFRITGTLPLRMTDFGIKPPRPFLGLIRVHDELEIHFDLRLQMAADPPPSGSR